MHILRSLCVSVQSTDYVFHIKLCSLWWFDSQDLQNYFLHLVWNILFEMHIRENHSENIFLLPVQYEWNTCQLLSHRKSFIKHKLHNWQRFQLDLYSLSGLTSYRKNSWSLGYARFWFRLFNRSDILKVIRQQSCVDARQISERYDHYNIQSRGFETSH